MVDRGDYDKYDEDNVDDYEYGSAAEYYEEPVQDNKHSSSVSDRYIIHLISGMIKAL